MSTRERPLRRGDLDPDPLRQFERWYEEAGRAVEFPEAVALATATPDGHPSVRMVLAKGFDEHGFEFHTGRGSRKAQELGGTGQGALLFYWHPLGRQVRIEGPVTPLGDEESAAWASAQSEVIGSREELEARVAELEREFEGRDVSLPPHWGGYRLEPEVWEFWQHRESRLHDRFRYRRQDGREWTIERLAP
jgi:pyridoxamine 5'-phosphate oxidase